MKEIGIVVIGHKDCGKSTLIGRLLYDGGFVKKDRLLEVYGSPRSCTQGRGSQLTVNGKLQEGKLNFAFLLDTFQEEREKGLTIDIVHTKFRSKKYLYTFIDCPGHKELIKNMLSGASEADAVLLLVSAKKNEGIQMQTKQHIFITKIIGVKQIVVAVTKMDTVSYDQRKFDEISCEIKEMLHSVDYKINVPIVPVSGLKGDNLLKRSRRMSWYGGRSLLKTLDEVLSPSKLPVDKPLRIPVQDLYSSGNNTFIVGKVESGRLRVKDKVIFYPSSVRGKVDKLLTVNRTLTVNREQLTAGPGENVAFTLKGTDVNLLRRGDVCGSINAPPHLSKRFIGQVIFLRENSKPRPCVQERGKQLKNILTLRCGTMNLPCRVKIIDRINSMGTAKVKVFISSPVVVEKYSDVPALGRFVISDEKTPIAAGIVLENELL